MMINDERSKAIETNVRKDREERLKDVPPLACKIELTCILRYASKKGYVMNIPGEIVAENNLRAGDELKVLIFQLKKREDVEDRSPICLCHGREWGSYMGRRIHEGMYRPKSGYKELEFGNGRKIPLLSL